MEYYHVAIIKWIKRAMSGIIIIIAIIVAINIEIMCGSYS